MAPEPKITNNFMTSSGFLELTSDATGNQILLAVDKITQITVSPLPQHKDKVRIHTVDGDMGFVVKESMRMIKARLKKLGCDIQ